MNDCNVCGGFAVDGCDECPHCGAALPARAASEPRGRSPLARIARGVATASTGGALALTLMACYGAPPPRAVDLGRSPSACNGADGDRDGSCAPADCNDADPNIHPAAMDMPNDGVDQDCNGSDATTLSVAQ